MKFFIKKLNKINCQINSLYSEKIEFGWKEYKSLKFNRKYSTIKFCVIILGLNPLLASFNGLLLIMFGPNTRAIFCKLIRFLED